MEVQRILVAILAALLVCGCTSRQLYLYGQEYQREQCRIGPPSAYEECMGQANESYETYERKKMEVEKDR